MTFGNGYRGQLGIGGESNLLSQSTPQLVPGSQCTFVNSLSAGNGHTLLSCVTPPLTDSDTAVTKLQDLRAVRAAAVCLLPAARLPLPLLLLLLLFAPLPLLLFALN